jgi:hypothetical protein
MPTNNSAVPPAIAVERKQKKQEMMSLPFIRKITKEERRELGVTGRIYWSVEPSSDRNLDWGRGYNYGKTAVEFMKKYRTSMLFSVVRSMVVRKNWGPIETGFMVAVEQAVEAMMKTSPVTSQPSKVEKDEPIPQEPEPAITYQGNVIYFADWNKAATIFNKLKTQEEV